MSEKKRSVKKVKSSGAKTSKKSSTSVVRKKSASGKNIESRVEDYLYNPNTEEKIEPPAPEITTVSSETAGTGHNQPTQPYNKKKKSLRSRVFKKIAKIIFVWVPLSLVSIIFILLILLKIILSPWFVKSIAEDTFNSLAFGSLELDIKKFDPYRGFEIENIIVKNGPEFNDSLLFTCKRLVVNYSFFNLFAGNVYIPEIGIYQPSIFLEEKDGVWNVSRLMKPAQDSSSSKKKDEAEIEETTTEPLTEINLPIGVEVLFNFILEDLYLSVKSKEFSAQLESFDTIAKIDIPEFTKVPVGPKAVALIKTFIVNVNPDEKLFVKVQSKTADISPPLLLNFSLNLDREKNKDSSFYSSFKAGTAGTPIRFQGAHLKPLSLRADYKLSYDPIKDYLDLETFGVTFAGDRWIDIRGVVKNLISEQNFSIKMAKSKIDLNKLYPYFYAITNDDSTRFGGEISLKPLEVDGNPENLRALGAVSLNSIRASVPDFSLDMPSLNLTYDVGMKKGDVKAVVGLDIARFRYKLGRFSSGINTLLLSLRASTANTFKRFYLSDFDFQFRDNKSGLNALSIKMQADADLSSGTSANVKMRELIFRKAPLINTLPSSIGSGLEAIPLKKAVRMNMQASYRSADNIVHKGDVNIGIQVPDYDVYDLKIATNSEFNLDNAIAKIHSFSVASSSYGLQLSSSGFVNTTPTADSPFADSDLKIKLRVFQSKLRRMFDEWKISGLIGLNARFRGDLKTGKVNGDILIKDLNVKNAQKDQLFDLEQMNMTFPFLYSFKSSFTGKEKTAADKSKLITNPYFKDAENFTIKSVRAKHPSRDLQYEFVKDFKATMFFRENSFEIEKLQATVLNGSIYMRDTFFYLADMDIDNMEYNLSFDATNIDVGKLDDPNKKTHESDLSLTTRLSGKGLNIAENLTTKGYITIFKIGQEFAKELMKGLSTKKGKSKLGITQKIIDNFMLLSKFRFFIDKGNVYAEVKLKKKGIATASGISVDNVKFDRIPIQEFLRNMKEGE